MANGGFCVPCMLFGIGSDNIDLGVLVSRPLTNFKKVTDELKAHDKKASHRDAVISADSPEFLAALIFTNRIFNYTANITRSLQSQSRDI